MRAMKDSGIEWIGEIPESWEITKHKYVMHKEKDICEHYNGEDIISLTMNGVIIRDLDAGGKMPTTFDGYQYVEPDKLLLCLFDIDVTPRCVGVIRNYGLTSPAYSKFFVHDGYSVEYYNYLLRAIDDDKVLVHLAKNLRSSFTETDFGALPTIAPPLPEQQSISAYLDRQCALIDNIIEKTKASIEEYKKLRQAVITQAVTKGVRGERAMKDSGIEWIGEIPEEWEVAKTKIIADRIVVGVVIKPADYFDEAGTVPFLRGINIKEYSIVSEPMVYITKESNLANSKSIIHTGDILIVRDGSIGVSCVVPSEYDGANVVSLIIVTCAKNNNPYYFAYSLNSGVGKVQFELMKIGTALTHTSVHSVSNISHTIPSIEEQNEIVQFLDKKCAEIDALITKKETFLTELESYKKSLIYEYVTGKKEVPQA